MAVPIPPPLPQRRSSDYAHVFAADARVRASLANTAFWGGPTTHCGIKTLRFTAQNVLTACLFCLALGVIGCGRETTVIQPTEEYQPTAQEKANQESFDAMREQGDRE